MGIQEKTKAHCQTRVWLDSDKCVPILLLKCENVHFTPFNNVDNFIEYFYVNKLQCLSFLHTHILVRYFSKAHTPGANVIKLFMAVLYKKF
jgi:hypothetical protein